MKRVSRIALRRLFTTTAANRVLQKPKNYEFSELYTFNHQNLPRLPIPALNDTLDRYVQNLRAVLLDPENLRTHEKNVEAFRTEYGPELQKKLVLEDTHHGYPYSFIERHWDDMYLQLRCPLPIQINPGYVLKDDPVDQSTRNPQALRVSKFIISTFRWQKKLMDGQMEKEAVPQCMAQLGRLLGTAREAHNFRDVLKFYPATRHIVVMRHGQFFRVDVMSSCRNFMLSQQGLCEQLQYIIDHVPHSDSRLPGIATLTVQDRDKWAKQREMLSEHCVSNYANIHDIDSALLVVCLDHTIPSTWNGRSEELLHGTVATVGNRWFDKIQLISCKSGSLSVLFEHSFSDGTTWNRWLSQVIDDMEGKEDKRLPRIMEVHHLSAGMGPRRLTFEIPECMEREIVAARREAEAMTRTCRTSVLRFADFGARDIKKWKFGPDGFVQMAFQYAFGRIHGHIAPTYESASMQNFFHGRTEVIRSAHAPAGAMVKALLADRAAVRAGKENPNRGQLEGLIREAAGFQGTVSRMAVQGKGVDRHLLALSKIASRDGIKAPMFHDEEFAYTTGNWRMSTSNVSTPWNECFDFGPVNDHCYGIGYLIHDDDIVVNTTTWEASDEVDANFMTEQMQASLRRMAAIVSQSAANPSRATLHVTPAAQQQQPAK